MHRALRDALAREGLVEIETDGQFDPHVHEALLAQPSEADEGSVIDGRPEGLPARRPRPAPRAGRGRRAERGCPGWRRARQALLSRRSLVLPSRAGRRDAASSVAPVPSGYERSLRPCLALDHHAPAAKRRRKMSAVGISTRSSASPRGRRRTRSRRRTASSPGSTTPTRTRATRRRRTASRSSRPPTTSSPTRRSARPTTTTARRTGVCASARAARASRSTSASSAT